MTDQDGHYRVSPSEDLVDDELVELHAIRTGYEFYSDWVRVGDRHKNFPMQRYGR
jgi:hypothetical protein